MKSAVIYYSMDGNTKAAAERIAGKLGADLIEVVPVHALPDKGFKKFFAGGRQATFGATPAIRELAADPADYDLIILGTPIWAGKCASPIWSFVNRCAVRDRIKAVFTLSGGGDNKKCIRQLEKKRMDIRASVSLLDRTNPKSEKNGEKTAGFVGSVRAIMVSLSR